jgi:methionyl-tRNA formyltransferase
MLRLLMLGTGPFAVPTFQSLLASPHQVLALVTQPTVADAGRRKAIAAPMRDAAVAARVPIMDPEDVNDPASVQALAAWHADLLVVCDYGQILSPELLALPPLGAINLHGSLLPAYRGAAPINWALLDGCTQTGVTVAHITPKLDSGPVLVQRTTAIGPTEDAVQLEARLAQLGVAAVHEAIALLAAWDRRTPLGTPQDAQRATRARRLRKSDGEADWSRSARQLYDQVRALKPWPGTFTTWRRSPSQEMRLILEQVSVVEESAIAGAAPPGTVVRAEKRLLHIATGAGLLSLDRVQPAGKRVMPIDEFLRGHSLQPGNRLGA